MQNTTQTEAKENARHTPGPWRAITEDGKWRIRSTKMPYIAIVYDAEEARLIAAAPELLSILKHIIPQLENDVHEAEISCDSLEYERSTERLEKARAAIAQAEGK